MKSDFKSRKNIVTVCLVLLLLLAGLSCQAQHRLFSTQTPTALGENSESGQLVKQTPIRPDVSTSTPSTFQDQLPGSEYIPCSYSPIIGKIINQTSASRWIDWIEKLSGAEAVTIGGERTMITTRYSPAMFNGHPNARAFEYMLETVKAWYPEEQVEIMEYLPQGDFEGSGPWKNLSVSIPGITRPDEIVLLTAHLDSISKDPENTAPGAEDNGSGTAALLEAARILKDFRFERTIQIIWFTGEEVGLMGSRAFVAQLENPENIVGVINLDMFGYDSDNDRCFELHVGELHASQPIGQCFTQSITAYKLDLPVYDYLIDKATGGSDHQSFWRAGIGAIEVLEDMSDQDQSGGCPASDPNPSYHSPGDTVDKINPETGIEIVRAALATTASIALPVE